MLEQIYHFLDTLLGLEIKDISAYYMINRAIIVYVFGMLLIILNKRFIGEKNSFDTILKFIIGNALANAIVGNSAFFATLAMVIFIVFINWLLSYLSYHIIFLEKILKGPTEILYNNNKIQWNVMKNNHITEQDLLSELRKISGIENLQDVQKIYFENSGEISVIPKNSNIKIKKRIDDLD